MRRSGILATAALLAVAGIAFADGGKIQWNDDYQQALAEAQRTGKPLMVKFFATW